MPICVVGATNCRDVQPFPAWANGGWTYFRLHHDQIFARFFWSADHLTWRVQFKSGELMELGAPYQSGDTSALAFDGDPKNNHVYRWNVTSRLDPQSSWAVNGIIYTWAKIDARSPFPYLQDIYDTPPVGVSTLAASRDSFEHHVHITWKPWSTRTTFPVVTPIWRAIPNYDISDIEVTSKVWGDESGSRGLVRRYHLRYDGQTPIANHEFLTSLQIEGNCGPNQAPREPLPTPPATTGCGRLPPTHFAYSDLATPHIETLAGSPLALPAAGRSDVTMMDVDNDGVMDFVQPPPAGSTTGTVYLDAFDGTHYTLRALDANFSSAPGVLARGGTYGLSLLGDWGGGQVDVQYWPDPQQHDKYSVLELVPTDKTRDLWQWATVGLPTIPLVLLDFDASSRFFDLDGDGLLDAYVSKPSPKAFLSTRAYVPATAPVVGPYAQAFDASHDPVWSHLDGTSADMDGDGVADLVIADPKGGGVYYFAGTGTGFDATAHGMRNTGGIQPNDLEQVYFRDVTGDGLADAVVLNETGGGSIPVAPGDLRVYVNVNGTLFGNPVVFQPPQLPSWTPGAARLEFADMNGSGIDDIVFIGGKSVGFVDLMATDASGAPRPGLLTKITNGRGVTTEITYVSTVQEQALPNVHWAMRTPQATAVVSTTRVYDVTTVGRGEAHLTAYNYRDPVYDGWQRKLLGFKGVTITHGDFATGATWSEDVTYFFDDRCAPSALQSFVDTFECVDDSPFEVLHGTPVLRETSSQGVSFLSTTHYGYSLQRLAVGLDGRRIWNAYRSQTDTFLYDAGSASTASVSLYDVFAPDFGGPNPRSVAIRAAAHVHLMTTAQVDRVGNTQTSVDMGRVDDAGGAIDSPITAAYSYVPIGDGSTWMWGVQTASVQPGTRSFAYDYDGSGNVLHAWGQLTGTVPLNRHHETGAATAPPPAHASSDNSNLLLATNVYNPDGSLRQRSGARSCVSFGYDQAFGPASVRRVSSRSCHTRGRRAWPRGQGGWHCCAGGCTRCKGRSGRAPDARH